MVFNCTGLITEWDYVVGEITGTAQTRECMELQVWRPAPGVMQTYTKVSHISTPTDLSVGNESFRRHQIKPNTPILVQPGDVFGVFIPPTQSCPYSLLFNTSGDAKGFKFSTVTSLNTTTINGGTSTDISIPLVTAIVNEGKLFADISNAYL